MLSVAHIGNKLLVKLRELVVLAVDQHVLIWLCVLRTFTHDQTVIIQQRLRYGRHPHKGIWNVPKQHKLCSALENINALVDMLRKFRFFTSISGREGMYGSP